MIQIQIKDKYDIIFCQEFETFEEAEILIENCKSYGYNIEYFENNLILSI